MITMPNMSRNSVYEYLKGRGREIDSTSLLGRLTESEREKFASDVLSECRLEIQPKGTTFISQLPRMARPIYLIRDGRVKIRQLTLYGHAIVDYKSAGEFVGEVDALLGQPPSMSARATESITVWEIPVNRFKTHIVRHPGFAAAVIQHLAARVNLLEQFRNIYKGKVIERVAQRLLDLGLAGYPGIFLGNGFLIHATQVELANSVGATLSAVEDEMRELRRAGVIRTARGVVHVDEPGYLVELLEAGNVETPPDYILRFSGSRDHRKPMVAFP